MIDAIPSRYEDGDLFSEPEKAAVAASLELTKRAELSSEAFDRLARHFDERQIVELVANIGIANLNNRVTDALAADIEAAE